MLVTARADRTVGGVGWTRRRSLQWTQVRLGWSQQLEHNGEPSACRAVTARTRPQVVQAEF